MGARVTGIDLSSASIELARQHAMLDPLIAKNVTYQAISTDQLAEQGGCTCILVQLYSRVSLRLNAVESPAPHLCME